MARRRFCSHRALYVYAMLSLGRGSGSAGSQSGSAEDFTLPHSIIARAQDFRYCRLRDCLDSFFCVAGFLTLYYSPIFCAA